MRKFSKILMLLVLFLLLPKNVSALLCNNDERVKYQDMARNITYSYDAVEKNGKVIFTLTFANVHKDLALVNARNDKWYYQKNQVITITNLEPNASYRYEVYSIADDGCKNMDMYTINVLLPSYNKYHKDSLCEGIEDYELCNKWKNVNYTYEEWKEKVKLYKDSLTPELEEDKIKDDSKTLLEKIIEAYGQLYYIVLPIVIVVGALTIYIYNKKRELF